jgi:hypothetical protein
MASTRSPRRVFGAGIVVGIVASIGAFQVAPIVAGSVGGPSVAGQAVTGTAEYSSHYSPAETLSDEGLVLESATDEYRRMYQRGAGNDSSLWTTSTEEYRTMYESR